MAPGVFLCQNKSDSARMHNTSVVLHSSGQFDCTPLFNTAFDFTAIAFAGHNGLNESSVCSKCQGSVGLSMGLDGSNGQQQNGS